MHTFEPEEGYENPYQAPAFEEEVEKISSENTDDPPIQNDSYAFSKRNIWIRRIGFSYATAQLLSFVILSQKEDYKAIIALSFLPTAAFGAYMVRCMFKELDETSKQLKRDKVLADEMQEKLNTIQNSPPHP